MAVSISPHALFTHGDRASATPQTEYGRSDWVSAGLRRAGVVPLLRRRISYDHREETGAAMMRSPRGKTYGPV
jgi:hypothetical protein